MSVLLDTHALLWWVADPSKLSRRAAAEIGKADAVLVSPISFWEIASLVRLGSIRIDRDCFAWVRDVLAEDRVDLAALTASAATAAGLLGPAFPGDPADRLIYATARELAVHFVTKDRGLRDHARATRDVRAIW